MTDQELVRNVCEHPKIYVRQGTFKCVVSWLNGYTGGILDNENRRDCMRGVDGFRDWLSVRCWKADRVARNLSWPAYLMYLYPSEEDALDHLPDLFDEFATQRDATNNGAS